MSKITGSAIEGWRAFFYPQWLLLLSSYYATRSERPPKWIERLHASYLRKAVARIEAHEQENARGGGKGFRWLLKGVQTPQTSLAPQPRMLLFL